MQFKLNHLFNLPLNPYILTTNPPHFNKTFFLLKNCQIRHQVTSEHIVGFKLHFSGSFPCKYIAKFKQLFVKNSLFSCSRGEKVSCFLFFNSCQAIARRLFCAHSSSLPTSARSIICPPPPPHFGQSKRGGAQREKGLVCTYILQQYRGDQ